MKTPREARSRNWLKMKLVGSLTALHAGEEFNVTEAEKSLINLISDSVQTLVMNWDKNSEVLGFNVRPFKCAVCGKRSKKSYQILSNDGIINVCKEHREEQV